MEEVSPKAQLLNRLGDLSKSILLVGALFYFFGFITLTSYLARFGIVSFDILNARFIIAGIITVVPLAVILWGSWELAKFFPLKKSFHALNISQRLFFIWGLPYTAYYIGGVFATLFNLGTYSPPTSNQALTFHAFGRWDLFGSWLAKVGNTWMPGGEFVGKYSLMFLFYVVTPVLLVYILVVCIKYLHHKKPVPQVTSSASADQKPKEQKTEIALVSGVTLKLLRVLEIVLLTFLVAKLFSAYLELGKTLADFSTITNVKLNQDLMGKWFFISIATFYFFISTYDVPKKGFSRSLFKEFSSFHDVPTLLYATLIPLVMSLILFGSAIFPRISYTIGGGQPRQVVLPKENILNVGEKDKVFMLGESSQHYFLVDIQESEARAIVVNKANIPYVITRTNAASDKK